MKKIMMILMMILITIIVVIGARNYYTYQQFTSVTINKQSLDININGYKLNYDNETNTKSARFYITINNYVVDNGSVMVITPKVISYIIEQNDINNFRNCRNNNFSKNYCQSELIENKIRPYLLYKINNAIKLLKREQKRISYTMSDSDVYDELQGLDIGNI